MQGRPASPKADSSTISHRKEALAVAGAEQWTARAEQLIFTLPSWTGIEDPLERLLAHIDFRMAMLDGPVEGFTCFVGTMVQETFASNDAIRAACDASITAYAERLAEDIQAAIDSHGIGFGLTALDLAYHIQAVLQGAFHPGESQGRSGDCAGIGHPSETLCRDRVRRGQPIPAGDAA